MQSNRGFILLFKKYEKKQEEIIYLKNVLNEEKKLKLKKFLKKCKKRSKKFNFCLFRNVFDNCFKLVLLYPNKNKDKIFEPQSKKERI